MWAIPMESVLLASSLQALSGPALLQGAEQETPHSSDKDNQPDRRYSRIM